MFTIEYAEPGHPVQLCLDVQARNIRQARRKAQRRTPHHSGLQIAGIKRSWGIPYRGFYAPA